MKPEDIWAEYQAGTDYKNSIDLYGTVNRNERFYAGDQWVGVSAPDLPKPVVNFIKRACQQRIAEVKSSPVKISFEPIEYPGMPVRGMTADAVTDADTGTLNAVFAADTERLKLDSVTLEGLKDACISGDFILYDYWDGSVPTGQPARGKINVELVDNVNFYPGDPNSGNIQTQPYIILARRENVASVRARAAAHGMQRMGLGQISAEGENWYQSGDMSRHELRGGGKCVTLLRMWRDPKSGRINACETTREAFVRRPWDTGLTRYPVAMMNWESRKNCCHGRAEITGLVPVQRYVNQMYAMMMLFSMQSACPKPIFNQGMIKAWSTAIGAAIPVNGDINGAAKYLECPQMPADAFALPDRLINRTFEMLGVSSIELGTFNPTNYSAISLTRQAAMLPIESIRTRFYAMLSDFASNWLDMTLAFQTLPRWQMTDSGRKAVVFDAASLRGRLWNVRTEVGPADQYSVGGAVDALKSLYESGAITAREFVERLPEGYLPMRSRLLGELESQGGDTPRKG